MQNQAHYKAVVNERVLKWVAITLARDIELHSYVSPSCCSPAVFRLDKAVAPNLVILQREPLGLWPQAGFHFYIT